MKVSIIIPAYNTGKTVRFAAESALNQAYLDVEVILVDDGSTDDTLQHCELMAGIDPRVKVISQENAGPGAARNAGLDAATGEWIAFLDADDHMGERYIVDLLGAAVKNQADMVISDCTICNGAQQRRFGFIHPGKTYIARRELWEDFMDSHVSWTLWGRLYRAELWENLRFRPGDYIAEDLWANAQIFAREGLKVVTVSSTEYFYTEAEGSADHSFSQRHLGQLQVFDEVAAMPAALGLELSASPDVWYEERVLNCMKKAIAAGQMNGEIGRAVTSAVKLRKAAALASPKCDRGLKLRLCLATAGPAGRAALMKV